MGEWLEHVGFPQYESKLVLNGFDDLRYMVSGFCVWGLIDTAGLSGDVVSFFPINEGRKYDKRKLFVFLM